MDLENQGNFILLPFRYSIQNGIFAGWQAYQLAVLIVLIAHENRKTRFSFPSVDRIATLARVGKKRVGEAVDDLAKRGWFTTRSIPTPNGRRRNEYRMTYSPYTHDDRKRWMWLPSSFVLRGVLGVMPDSAFKLYLALHGLSWNSSLGWIEGACGDSEPAERDRFVDASNLSPKYLSAITGLPDRTRTDGWNWLINQGLLVVPERYYYDDWDGVWLPDPTGFSSPAVMEKLEDIKTRSSRQVSKGTKNLLTRARRKQRTQQSNDKKLVFAGGTESQQKNI